MRKDTKKWERVEKDKKWTFRYDEIKNNMVRREMVKLGEIKLKNCKRWENWEGKWNKIWWEILRNSEIWDKMRKEEMKWNEMWKDEMKWEKMR